MSGGNIDGEPIYSPCEGYVIDTGNNLSTGYRVNWQSTTEDPNTAYYIRMGFYHLKYRSVLWDIPSSTLLPKGTLIGYTGSTGDSDGPHLHFYVTKDGTFTSFGNVTDDLINPTRFFPNISFTGDY